INRRLLDEVRRRFPGDSGRAERVSLIEENGGRKVRMANLAIVGSHSTNRVAAIHSDLLRRVTVKELAEMYPDRCSDRTNGVTRRGWMLPANRELARGISEAIGEGWISNLAELEQLRSFTDDAGFREDVRHAKHHAKSRFAHWLHTTSGVTVDPES